MGQMQILLTKSLSQFAFRSLGLLNLYRKAEKFSMNLIAVFLLITFFCACQQGNISNKHLALPTTAFNQSVKDFISRYKGAFGSTRFIVTVHFDSYSCQGMKIVMINRPMNISVIKECPFDYYMIIDSTLILVYMRSFQIKLDSGNNVDDDIISIFPKSSFKDDWDAVKNEPTEQTTYNSMIKGYEINGDSFSKFTPPNPPSFYSPCIPCPLPLNK